MRGPAPAPASPARSIVVAVDAEDRDAVLARRADAAGVELAETGSISPGAAVALGRAGFAIVYGDAVDAVRGVPGVRVGRAPGWDRTWLLWVEDEGPWVVDPAFRRWLAATLDPVGWPALLFGGEATAVSSVLPGAPRSPALESPRRPFDDRTRPGLVLRTDGSDPADRIASRLRAELDVHGVRLRASGDGRASARLLVHRRAGDDALDDLRRTLRAAGESALPWLERLRRLEATGVGREERERAAATLERRLQEAGRLIPLVREHAWSVRAESAGAVRAGRYGEIVVVGGRAR